MTTPENQTCYECGSRLKGRADKKFCSDQCRVTFNNNLKRKENRVMNHINNILRKNRNILRKLNPQGKSRISRERMNEAGFNFSYFTSTYTTKEGAKYFYCYDQGYLPMEKDQCLLVVKKDFTT